jgi:hypothetical protein
MIYGGFNGVLMVFQRGFDTLMVMHWVFDGTLMVIQWDLIRIEWWFNEDLMRFNGIHWAFNDDGMVI